MREKKHSYTIMESPLQTDPKRRPNSGLMLGQRRNIINPALDRRFVFAATFLVKLFFFVFFLSLMRKWFDKKYVRQCPCTPSNHNSPHSAAMYPSLYPYSALKGLTLIERATRLTLLVFVFFTRSIIAEIDEMHRPKFK